MIPKDKKGYNTQQRVMIIYTYFSRKYSTSFNTLPSLLLDGCPLELVSSFKSLGVTLNSNLSWSTHINDTCSKVKKLLGCIYRQFYYNSSSSVLIKLYLTLILPILMYSSAVWDPHSTLDINKPEKVQHFALKLCNKHWTSDYRLLLQLFNLPSLPLVEQHPSLSSYTSIFLANSISLLVLFHLKISPLTKYIPPTH